MSILSTLTIDDSIENERDVIGASGPLDSGIYKLTVALAYLNKSEGGALGLNVVFKTEQGRELRQTFWMTSGTAKGCKNYYEDKQGQKQYLPGFLLANALTLLTVGKEIGALDTETKVVKLYNYEAKAEVPTKVEVLVDLLDQEVLAGVIRQVVDKNVKNDAGAYVPSGETREENEIDKLFRERDRLTTAEIRAQATEPAFIESWEAKWTGKTKNRAKGAQAGTAPVAGMPKLGGNSATTKKPTTSLFA